MNGIMIIALVVLLIVLSIVVWYISTSNKIKRLDIKVSEALSGIDVALTKRYDVLTKMVDVVRSYKEYEKQTFTDIVGLRMGMSMQERKDASAKLDILSSELRLVAENYPVLKSSENYVMLQKSVLDVEEHLQASRRLYNANVTAYNNMLVTFPSSVVANGMGAVRKPFFEAEAPFSFTRPWTVDQWVPWPVGVIPRVFRPRRTPGQDAQVAGEVVHIRQDRSFKEIVKILSHGAVAQG